MNKKLWGLFVIVLLVFLSSACERSQSTSPIATGAAIPTPLALDKSYQDATQTAQVMQLFGTKVPTATLAEVSVPDITEAVEETPEAAEDAPTATLAVINTPVVERPATYAIKEGEFPYCIARRFDVDANTLLTLNGLATTTTFIAPGTVIKIPQTGAWSNGSRALHAHPTTHTVKAGETIYILACYYGDVSPEAIAAVNNLTAPYTLTVGQTLQIP